MTGFVVQGHISIKKINTFIYLYYYYYLNLSVIFFIYMYLNDIIYIN